MKKQLNTEEKLIQFFISEFNKDTNNSNEILISQSDIKSIGITENEAARNLLLMQSSDYIVVKDKNPSKDFNTFWTIEVKDSCLNFFINQKYKRIQNRNNWIQFWIPVSISNVALIVAIITA